MSWKKINEFSCYVKIEKNGIEIKNKLHLLNSFSKIIYLIYKDENTIEQHLIKVVNYRDEEFFRFNKTEIQQIFSKIINEGKITIIIKRLKESYVIFIFKTTQEILEHFIKYLIVAPDKNLKNDKNEKNEKNEKTEKTEKNEKTENLMKTNTFNESNKSKNSNFLNKMNFKLNQKRKFKDLYTNYNNSNTLCDIEKPKPKIPLFNKFNKLSFDIHDCIREYLDEKSLLSLALTSRQIKKYFDFTKQILFFKNDTPAHIYKCLLSRFQNLTILKFGNGKYLKNETFRFFEGNLKFLKIFEMSKIINLNEKTITKLLSRIKNNILEKIFLNIELECLSNVLVFIEYFFKNLNEINLVTKKN